jgi:uncharacterized membrane protein YgaE (UPF0421/DUF939 family)
MRSAAPATETRLGRLRGRLLAACSRALHRATTDLWPLLQGTAAATAAWLIAKHLVNHHEPFFAPIAALVALNTSLGERGLNALRLLQGVGLGIVVGEVTIAVVGGGWGSMAVAILVATVAARASGGARVTVAQAAVGAILTVSVANGQVGIQRLVDALIGAGVALVFSQLLFSPDPIALLRRFEAAALTGMAQGLELTARALEADDESLEERAMETLRDVRDHLAELGRVRRASTRVVRHSLVWRTRMAPVVRERENAGHLDLLGVSCLMLTRTALAARPVERAKLLPAVRELAGTLADLAGKPGDRATRQHAVERALDVARRFTNPGAPETEAEMFIARMVAGDVMVFAGIDSEQALAAIQGDEQLDVPAPASTPHRGASPRPPG